MKFEWCCRLDGPRFSPKLAQAKTGLVLKDRREPGEVASSGRYRGQPLPYGSATWVLQAGNSDRFVPGDAALRKLEAELPKLRAAGAVDIEVHVLIAYQGQCNFEFSSEELSKLARLGVPLTVSCYEEKS